ncbi:MAG: cell envelope biogenesis protein TolA [Synergistaceae bacterium]|jgi:vacuolar-type H+-ATPase subunit H|nr:cell envelope biogenesis protein TolA [Synergistaceae bacterium]
MTVNLAEEIKIVEARSKETIKEAKNEAARLVNDARSDAERRIKEARQKDFRNFREMVASVEKEAEGIAQKNVDAGIKKGNTLAQKFAKKVPDTAKWIAEEVISRYGRG